MTNRGLLLVVSGPSGCGKGTVCAEVLSRHPEIFLSVSATTREPRDNEMDGKQYFFLTEKRFQEQIDQGGFIEWACFCEHYYGTPKEPVERSLSEGRDVILEIDVQGAMKVRDQYPEAVFLFVVPPSLDELRRRLTARGTESAEVVEKRLEKARWEIAHTAKYNYIILNDTVEQAAARFEAIMAAEKVRTARSGELLKKLLEE